MSTEKGVLDLQNATHSILPHASQKIELVKRCVQYNLAKKI